ncbi:MAG: ABC transporter permease [Gemmataceae bacterium]|nr:ABC transporter permease [Gemmataceae bacterium]
MSRLLGILLMVLLLYGALLASNFEDAGSIENHRNIARRTGYFGILTLGVGLLIISGGIDLSIGSVVGLSAISFGLLLEKRMSPVLAIVLVLSGTVLIGLFHGLLVTKLRLQPFIVTLCGLFIYRGLAQLAPILNFQALWANLAGFSWDQNILQGSSRDVGIGGRPDLADLRYLASGEVSGVPMILILMIGVATVATVLLHLSVYGRYLYAIGYNEQAARYAGIATDQYKILAYVWCSLMAGVGGVLLLLDLETAQPTAAGGLYELYAITGAVLGGCSLRGGQGMVAGIILGTSVLPLLRNLCIFAGIPSDLEYTVIGLALLLGTVADELLKRRAAARG